MEKPNKPIQLTEHSNPLGVITKNNSKWKEDQLKITGLQDYINKILKDNKID